MGKLKIGVQLYTLRNEMAQNVEQTLREVAKLGFEGIEFAGYFNWDAEKLKTLLDELNLKVISSHVSMEKMKENLQEELNTLVTLGAKYIVCPFIPKDSREHEEDWLNHIHLFNQVSQEASMRGLTFLYHNHDFEFYHQVNQKFAFDAIFESTSPRHVQAELDVCWVQFAGQDPISYIKKYAGRLPIIHTKDFDRHPDGQIRTLELGQGLVDLPKVIQAAKTSSVEWLVIEQDVCQKPPIESIANSLQWLKNQDLTI
jgi:sugar phosphate isomerase/epimerase